MSNHIPREVLPIPRHRQASSAMYDYRDPEARVQADSSFASSRKGA